MFASRILFSILSIGVLSAAATPAPAVVKRADTTDVLAIVTNLQDSTNTILPQIDSLVATNSATQSNISPLLAQLTSAFGTASSSFSSLQGNVDTSSGPSQSQIASQFAPIISNTATSLNNLKKHHPEFAPLFLTFGIDVAINTVLVALDVVVVGVAVLVGKLLVSVAVILNGLGFTISILTLGLGGLLGIL